MKDIKRSIVLLFILFSVSVFSQTEDQTADTVSGVNDQYHDDLKFMIQSFQTMLNLLGDPEVSRQDKDQMINQSYLKYFESDMVQIEDDLDPNRQLPINKNVQSYLQDIVFFYKNIRFEFEFVDVSKGLNDKNQLYYKVSLKERLEGLNLYGEPFNEINDRYIEFNLDEKAQEFKMVSVYTTKLSEKEDIAAWWNELNIGWRKYFAPSVSLNDSIAFDSLLILNDNFSIGDTLLVMRVDTSIYDTTYIISEEIFSSIKKVFASTEILIQPSDSIRDLSALSKFTNLEKLDFSFCPIDEVSPLRSLLSLREINASSSLLTSLDDLQYLSGLIMVNIDDVAVSDLSISENWRELKELSMANSSITELQFIASLKSLENLNLKGNESLDYAVLKDIPQLISLDLSSSTFDDLSLINNLPKLHSLNLNETPLRSLEGLSDSLSIRIISFENTAISELSALKGIEELKIVYCDNSAVNQESVSDFILDRPAVLVIYETKSLLTWWENLNDNLKDFIRSRIDSITEPPNTETLHAIIFTESANLAGQESINSLEGFQSLINLKDLDISGTSVEELGPISSLNRISELNISNTPITELASLANIEGLSTLNIEDTKITDLEELTSLPNIELIKADNSSLSQENALKFTRENGALVLYQSAYLIQWWELLDDEWARFFSKKLDFNKNPTAKDLQTLVNIDSLSISGFSPASLEPLDEFKLLITLELDKVDIVDLSILTHMEALQNLKINNGPVSDYASLSTLKNLKSLDLSNTSINNLDFVVSLSGLEEIIIAGTAVESIKSLITLSSLRYIDLSNTKIKRISYLNKLQNLKEVKLTNTGLSQKKIDNFKRQRPEVNVIIY